VYGYCSLEVREARQRIIHLRASLAWKGVGCAASLRAPRMTFFKYGAGAPTPRSS
jgi:hypothetical protein